MNHCDALAVRYIEKFFEGKTNHKHDRSAQL
jgi:hypothetical protein